MPADEVWPYDCVLWIYDRIQYLCGQLYEQGIRDFGWLDYDDIVTSNQTFL
jgi:hypothetical protein